MCGTNAHSPKDWVIYVSIQQIMRFSFSRHVTPEYRKKKSLLGADTSKLRPQTVFINTSLTANVSAKLGFIRLQILSLLYKLLQIVA